MSKPKIVYVISDIDRATNLKWIVDRLSEDLFDLYFVLINSENSHFSKYLKAHEYQVMHISYGSNWQYPMKLWQLIIYLIRLRPKIMHTHYRRSNLLGIPAAFLVRVKHRIQTRHNGTYNILNFPISAKIDILLNFMSTKIVAISRNVEIILHDKELVPKSKIVKIFNGFDLNWFRPENARNTQALKHKYEISSSDYPVVGVIGRYVNWKGHQYVIEAFKSIYEVFPNGKLVLGNAFGPESQQIKNLLSSKLPPTSYIEIEYEPDITSLYGLFDVFVHVPIDLEQEAFGQIYVESLAMGIPSVVTLSGVAPEFIRDGENALVVPFKDSASVTDAVIKILKNSDLRSKLVENGLRDVQGFDIDLTTTEISNLYLRLLNRHDPSI